MWKKQGNSSSCTMMVLCAKLTNKYTDVCIYMENPENATSSASGQIYLHCILFCIV